MRNTLALSLLEKSSILAIRNNPNITIAELILETGLGNTAIQNNYMSGAKNFTRLTRYGAKIVLKHFYFDILNEPD